MAVAGEWAVITGASSGLGRIFAQRLAARNFNLVIAARRGQLLEGLAQEIRSMNGVQVEVLVADLQTFSGCDQVASVLQRPDVTLLINNAGYGKSGPLLKLDAGHAMGQVELNVLALTRLTHAAAQAFVRRGVGGIMNISSVAGFTPVPGLAIYAATKAYARNFTLAVADEMVGTGVKVAAVCPGYTDTGFFDVAEIGSRARQQAMDPAAVVDFALSRFDAGDVLIVPGASNQVVVQLGQHLPLRLAAKLAGFIFRRQMSKA